MGQQEVLTVHAFFRPVMMEKKKIDIEMQKQKFSQELRFEVQLEEKVIDLLASEDYDSESNEDNLIVRNEDETRFSLEPHLPKQEQTAKWVANCQQETKPLNPKAPEFIRYSGINSTQAVLLRVTTLQAMQPVEFSGSAADFPVFRRRIRDYFGRWPII